MVENIGNILIRDQGKRHRNINISGGRAALIYRLAGRVLPPPSPQPPRIGKLGWETTHHGYYFPTFLCNFIVDFLLLPFIINYFSSKLTDPF